VGNLIFEGKSYEEAVEKGLKHFNISEDQAKITVIKEGKKVFGVSVEAFVVDVVPLYSIEERIDGYYKILYRDDGVYLEVHAPVGSGAGISVEDVRKRLEYKKVESVDYEAVARAIKSGEDNTLRIAPPQEELKYDASIIVEISPDATKAFMTLLPPDGGKMITAEEAVEILKQNGIVVGLDHEKIQKVITENIYGKPVQIAAAILPEDGKNGYVDYKIKYNKNRKPTIKDDGSVDFRELDLIENVKAGQVLAVLVPPTPGVDGTDVRGNTIKAKPGIPSRIQKGKNTDLIENGTVLVSLLDGQVSESGGKINVFPVYEVAGNVDNSTGNIHFVGKVVVRGNVLTGFEIEAEGDIEVNGVVEGANLRSGGNIILKRGVQGRGRGSLVCMGNLYSKFIENCNVQAEGDVVAEAIMHSKVTSKSIVEVKGRKGLIVGGTVAARMEISAKIVGSPMATLTYLEVGVDPDLRRDVDRLSRSVEEDQKSIEQLNLSIATITKMAQKGRVPADKKILLAKCIEAKAQIEENIKEKKAQLALLKSQLEAVSKGRVRVKEILYPGIVVTIGSSSLHIKDQLEYVTLYRSEGEIKMGTFEA
jgi:hypothetical protein